VPKFFRFRKKQIKIDGYTFDSQEEANRYESLKLRWRAGEISVPEVHPEFPVNLNGFYCWTYIADFRYRERQTGIEIVEDVKGGYWKKKQSKRKGIVVKEWKVRAPILEDAYKVKKPIVEALYEIKITEVWK
jgi:hypothetical protein